MGIHFGKHASGTVATILVYQILLITTLEKRPLRLAAEKQGDECSVHNRRLLEKEAPTEVCGTERTPRLSPSLIDGCLAVQP